MLGLSILAAKGKKEMESVILVLLNPDCMWEH